MWSATSQIAFFHFCIQEHILLQLTLLYIYILHTDYIYIRLAIYIYIYIYIFDRNLSHIICFRHEFCSNFMARKNCIQSLQKHHARNGLLFPQHTFLDRKLVIFQWLDNLIRWFKMIIIRLWGSFFWINVLFWRCQLIFHCCYS